MPLQHRCRQPEPAFDDLMRRVLLVKPEKKKPAKRKTK
jgi:hypothetical protein